MSHPGSAIAHCDQWSSGVWITWTLDSNKRTARGVAFLLHTVKVQVGPTHFPIRHGTASLGGNSPAM